MKSKKELVFIIEYYVDIDQNMQLPLEEILEKARETGSAEIKDVLIREKA